MIKLRVLSIFHGRNEAVDRRHTFEVTKPSDPVAGGIPVVSAHDVFRNANPVITKMHPIVVVRSHFVFDRIAIIVITAFLTVAGGVAIEPRP